MKNKLKSILLTGLLSLSFSSFSQDFKGSWKGAIAVQGMSIELIFNIKENEKGYETTLDVPIQGVSDFPLENTTVTGSEIEIKSAKLQLNYVGELIISEITGTYSQMGKDYPLILTKTTKTLPGNTSLPSSAEALAKIASMEKGAYKYSVKDYFQKPEASYFQLSPTGEYLSYIKRNSNGKGQLIIKNTENDKELVLVTEVDDVIKGYFWASNSRLLYLQDQGGNENFHVYGVNTDGSNKVELTPYQDTKVDILEVLRDDEAHIIITMNKDNKKQEEPYKLNINTGEINKLYTIGEEEDPIAGYLFDKTGELKGLYKVVNGVEMEVYYKVAEQFEKVKLIDFGSSFGIIGFNYATEYPHDVYVSSNLESDKTEIQLFDLKANKIIKTIYKNDTYDVSNIRLSKKRNYEIDYVSYNGEKAVVVPMSPTFKKIHKNLKALIGDKQFFATYRSEDEDIYMVLVTSDKIQGEYYTYNVKDNKLKLIYKVLPNLKEEDMASMQPITFKSRDGLIIHGYITLPKAAIDGKKVPLIVMPHGGPQGVRDSWGFIKENQLFASRGYATLNVNFRISGGYGKAFMAAGYNQIGRKAMDDVEDGIAYAIEQGWVDEERIAIFGASHGGYAVLRGMTKTPDLYACGVDYVGVSNLNTFMNTIPAYWEKYRDFLYKTWYDPNNPEQKKIMDEISPALHTDLIQKPLMVVQGANDPRVNIDEADQIVSQLRARGIEVPYMVKYDEGHGFYKEENSIDLYETMMGFFAMHLK
ncbi:MAG: S9 family peptidase [Putridiphycobacter sp.]|nr:S9 family peptidase [Putridiphycobacter sp.]